MPNLRETSPVRAFDKTYAKHTQYKTQLRSDFNKRCGYCDDHDLIQGGKRTYQVDHFVPMNPEGCVITIPHNLYANLVYACSFCNRAKWNKWPTNDETLHNDGIIGFIDPCEHNYAAHFERLETGEIMPLTDLGNYMWKEVKLFLKRHAIIWKLERLSHSINEIQKISDTLPEGEKRNMLYTYLLAQNEFLAKLKVQDDEE